MEKRDATLRALALGAVVGVVVLGWMGRIATFALAFLLGLPANASVTGIVGAPWSSIAVQPGITPSRGSSRTVSSSVATWSPRDISE